MDVDRAGGLASAWRWFCFRVERQRRVRAWAAAGAARREARLARTVFAALARGSHSRAAEAAAIAGRCRAALAAWHRGAARERAVRVFQWQRMRTLGVIGLRRWRRRVFAVGGLAGLSDLAGDEIEAGRRAAGLVAGWDDGEGLGWRLLRFKERRAKRVVLRAWYDAVAGGTLRVKHPAAGAAATATSARGFRGVNRTVVMRGNTVEGKEVFTMRRGQAARLRTAEVR